MPNNVLLWLCLLHTRGGCCQRDVNVVYVATDTWYTQRGLLLASLAVLSACCFMLSICTVATHSNCWHFFANQTHRLSCRLVSLWKCCQTTLLVTCWPMKRGDGPRSVFVDFQVDFVVVKVVDCVHLHHLLVLSVVLFVFVVHWWWLIWLIYLCASRKNGFGKMCICLTNLHVILIYARLDLLCYYSVVIYFIFRGCQIIK